MDPKGQTIYMVTVHAGDRYWGWIGPFASRKPAEALARVWRECAAPGTALNVEAVGMEAFEEGAPATRENPWASSTEVQTLLFDAGEFSPDMAKVWAREHGFCYGKVDPASGRARYHRVRQHPPEEYMKARLRTITFGPGVKAVIGVPKRSTGRQRRREKIPFSR